MLTAGDQQALEYRKLEELRLRRLNRDPIREPRRRPPAVGAEESKAAARRPPTVPLRLLILRPPMEVVQERKRVPSQQRL